MSEVLEISADFEASRDAVVAAMLFPRNEALRSGYRLRNAWSRRLAQDGGRFGVEADAIQALLDAPSRVELRNAAVVGVKRGTVAGDLLLMIYEQWRNEQPEPSLRSALRRYRSWSLGKRYGNGSALKYSDAQLRTFFAEAEPAAHLWGAFRAMVSRGGRSRSDRLEFTPAEMPLLLGTARALQDFATTFTPKRTRPPKPVIDSGTLLPVPTNIEPISIDVRLL